MTPEAVASQKEVRITYETLYELFRREKNKEEVQQLDPAFYADVLQYFREKQEYYNDCMAKSDLFSISERDKTLQQLQNAKRLLRDLYERREKKIIDLAVNKSRTNSNLINTANLLAEEKAFFQALVDSLNKWRDGVLVKIMALQQPQLEQSLPAQQQTAPAAVHQPAPQEAESAVGASTTKLVRFLEPVEQFVGEELEPYGPFNSNDKAYLPFVLAEILIGSGKAVELQEE